MPILLDGLVPALASAAYAFAWILSWRRVSAPAALMAAGGRGGALLPGRAEASGTDPARWPLLAALALHGLALVVPPMVEVPARFGFAQAISTALWLGACLLWLEGFAVRMDALRMLVLPASALAVWLPAFFPGVDVSAVAGRPFFVSHLVIAMLAYSVMTVAALHAILMALAERALHAGGLEGSRDAPWFRRWLDSLPPLLVLERMLFRLIGLGFALLTLTVMTGIFFGEEIFGRAFRWDHKTVFSLLAWSLFGALLLGRVLWGWRGRTALRLTLGGFTLLLLAYVGSRFVLEVVLARGF